MQMQTIIVNSVSVHINVYCSMCDSQHWNRGKLIKVFVAVYSIPLPALGFFDAWDPQRAWRAFCNWVCTQYFQIFFEVAIWSPKADVIYSFWVILWYSYSITHIWSFRWTLVQSFYNVPYLVTWIEHRHLVISQILEDFLFNRKESTNRVSWPQYSDCCWKPLTNSSAKPKRWGTSLGWKYADLEELPKL